ncbi:hypothetical protein MKW92_034862, partial [Papaver armeniacum]
LNKKGLVLQMLLMVVIVLDERYDRKQSGGQTKPIFHKKTTKKIVLKLQCQSYKHMSQHAIK